ncbi:MAG: hypothetical protein HC906_13365 [Bacteroidales bacterium]|nr:hypothetical protein [Bacteroidales bacterium]
MIIAIPASERKIEAIVDERFGRCPFFCFYHTDSEKIEFKENLYKDAIEAVGLQVAEFLAEFKINEVLATEIGPKAQNILNKLNIKSTIIERGKTIQEIVNTFVNNKF